MCTCVQSHCTYKFLDYHTVMNEVTQTCTTIIGMGLVPPLLLPPRHRVAPLPHHRGVAIRKLANEPVSIGQSGCLVHLQTAMEDLGCNEVW